MVGNQENEVPVVKRIEKIYSKIDYVKDLSYKVTNHRKYDYYEFINALAEKRIQLEDQLNQLKGSSANTYDEIMEGIEHKLSELTLVLQQIKEKFNEE